MKGFTFEFALNWVFEIEEKKQYHLNRIRLDEYFKDLLLGLAKLFKSTIWSDNEEALKAGQEITLAEIATLDLSKYLKFEEDEEYIEHFKTALTKMEDAYFEEV